MPCRRRVHDHEDVVYSHVSECPAGPNAAEWGLPRNRPGQLRVLIAHGSPGKINSCGETHVPPQSPASPPLLEQVLPIARASAPDATASGFAHEINQPIGAIATCAQAAERMLGKADPAVAAAREVLGHISHEALNAGNGIRRIRNLCHRAESARTVCAIAGLIEELQPVLALLASRSGVELETHIAGELPAVAIDRLR